MSNFRNPVGIQGGGQPAPAQDDLTGNKMQAVAQGIAQIGGMFAQAKTNEAKLQKAQNAQDFESRNDRSVMELRELRAVLYEQGASDSRIRAAERKFLNRIPSYSDRKDIIAQTNKLTGLTGSEVQAQSKQRRDEEQEAIQARQKLEMDYAALTPYMMNEAEDPTALTEDELFRASLQATAIKSSWDATVQNLTIDTMQYQQGERQRSSAIRVADVAMNQQLFLEDAKFISATFQGTDFTNMQSVTDAITGIQELKANAGMRVTQMASQLGVQMTTDEVQARVDRLNKNYDTMIGVLEGSSQQTGAQNVNKNSMNFLLSKMLQDPNPATQNLARVLTLNMGGAGLPTGERELSNLFKYLQTDRMLEGGVNDPRQIEDDKWAIKTLGVILKGGADNLVNEESRKFATDFVVRNLTGPQASIDAFSDIGGVQMVIDTIANGGIAKFDESRYDEMYEAIQPVVRSKLRANLSQFVNVSANENTGGSLLFKTTDDPNVFGFNQDTLQFVQRDGGTRMGKNLKGLNKVISDYIKVTEMLGGDIEAVKTEIKNSLKIQEIT